MGRKVYVIGVGMVKFQKPGSSDPYDVMAQGAARAALQDASVVQTRLDSQGAWHALSAQLFCPESY